ncbi:MAG: phosphoribosyltransferase [Cyanobacteria bacterium]|nr:phosphoribosyltransferase [Cyanobacteriota bacterium]
MGNLRVSWEDYHRQIEQLAVQIHDSGWEFDRIVCLARGGLRVGDVLSRLFDRPLAILFASSYGGAGGRSRGELHFSQALAMTDRDLGGRVLVADDLADTGITLARSLDWLRQHYGDRLVELRTAVLWCKACSTVRPDYYGVFLADNPWIEQPFEVYDAMDLDQLAQKYADP